MLQTAHDPDTDGRVVFELQEDGILVVRYTGDITLDLTEKSGDILLQHIAAGVRRILFDVAGCTPVFTPVSVLDEVRRIGRAAGKEARFCYLAPENMFTRHFMLIEAAAFNDGINVKFLADENEAKAWLIGD